MCHADLPPGLPCLFMPDIRLAACCCNSQAGTSSRERAVAGVARLPKQAARDAPREARHLRPAHPPQSVSSASSACEQHGMHSQARTVGSTGQRARSASPPTSGPKTARGAPVLNTTASPLASTAGGQPN